MENKITGIEVLENKIGGLVSLRTVIRKGEKIFRGENRVDDAMTLIEDLERNEIEYNVLALKTQIVLTF